MMAIYMSEKGIYCTDCNVSAMSKKSYEEMRNRDIPDFFYEPWDDSDEFLFVCPKCKNEDFPS